MTTLSLIAQCRREHGDSPKTTRVSKQGDGSTNIFNTGKYPIIEDSYTVRQAGSALIEGGTSGFTIDRDTGDITLAIAPGNGVEIAVDLQYADWNDQNWTEAINGAISHLNARGFFKQITREAITLSANVSSIPGPTNAIDVYELLYTPTSGSAPVHIGVNWSYQQDANKIILGAILTSQLSGKCSYLRNLQTYSATSATLDIDTEWQEMVKKRAGATYYRSLAGRTAKQGNATIEEGHISFSNLRTNANDLDSEFERLALRKKPTRPAKNIAFIIDNGGIA